MSAVVNQFSAVIAYIILALLFLALVLWRAPKTRSRLILLSGAGGFILGGFFLFQPVHDNDTAVPVTGILAVGNGRPVLIELYSDY